MEELKRLLRAFFYKSALGRLAIGGLSVLTGRTRPLRVMRLLSYVEAK